MIEFRGSRLVMSSELEHLGAARAWAADRARDADIDDEGVAEVALAVTEALANVINHSYEGREGLPITIHAVVQSGGLVLMISDEGAPFVAADHEAVDLNEAHEGGYGVFLIDSLMDSVQRHSPTNGDLGTDLVLIKGTITDVVNA